MPNELSIYKQARFEDLPAERRCNKCGETKPREEMVIKYKRDRKHYYLNAKCKGCNNDEQRGHRREYKTAYLRRWRRENKELNRSYWNNDQAREKSREAAYRHWMENADAKRIQGRLRRHGQPVTLAEAKELLAQYGRCYPTQFGLTDAGKRECERIRSRQRVRNVDPRSRLTNLEIRQLVYEENEGNFASSGWVIRPDLQPEAYKVASERLKQYHRNNRIVAAEVSA